MKRRMINIAFPWFVLALTSTVLIPSSTIAESPRSVEGDKKIVGHVETVVVQPENFILRAKLAPASESSSLHADSVDEFIRDGKTYVRFTLSDRNGNKQTLERKVLRKASIKRPSAKTIRRYVVGLRVCIGNQLIDVDAGLADRSGLDEELRIGREALAGFFLIDPSQTHSRTPRCTKKK